MPTYYNEHKNLPEYKNPKDWKPESWASRNDVFPSSAQITLPKVLNNWLGFDSLFDRLLTLDEGTTSYPPFNVVKISDNEFDVQIAVAGFDKNNLTVTEENGTLIVSGENDSDETEYLYKGIGLRKFTKRFALSEHMRVKETWYDNGILTVSVIREVPEALKPKTFKIK
ncbi:MAG: heat-shock protein [Alphaproteobacteria bacterium]|nr:heat-shock protein [Alphaproteobacteria bacterium]